MASKSQQLPGIASLMSPPEPLHYDSFSRESPGPTMSAQSKQTSASLPSPPVTPMVVNDGPDTAVAVTDPILYDVRDSATSPAQSSLFGLPVDDVVDQHMRVRSLNVSAAPQRRDYILALEFKSEVAKLFNADRKGWQIRERNWLVQDQQIRSAAASSRYKSIAPLQTARSNASQHSSPTSRPPKNTTPRRPRDGPRPPRVAKDGTVKSGRGGPRDNHGPINREDKKFELLEDFAPPIDSLPYRNSLKVDWKGGLLDLRNDPHRHLLNDEEVHLASTLRLDCATYLTSKRRIFIRRTECLKINKEFRKTDAQQACKIDVNKASKLWMAYDKVGWLEPHWVEKYVNRV